MCLVSFIKLCLVAEKLLQDQKHKHEATVS